MKVKICGQTSAEDCAMSVRCGADFLGVVYNVAWSPRSLDIERARPIFDAFRDRTFLLAFNMAAGPELLEAVAALDPYALQLTGQETPETVAKIKEAAHRPVFKSVHLAPESESGLRDPDETLALMESYTRAGVDGFILDTATKGLYGGTGVRSDWSFAARVIADAPGPVLLAGGINPDNVAQCVRISGLYGIDLASGAESEKGKKSEEKLMALFEAIRGIS